MAFSQPLADSVRRKGQSALVCQLCEHDPKIKWKCVDCGLLMCQKCRDKIHPRFASADDHTIIDIKDISKHQADSGPKLDLTRIKCGLHSGQNCYLFCKTCQELVCQICITKTHNKHEFGDISDEYEIKMEKIRNGQRDIEKEMRSLTVSEQKLKLIKSNEQSNYDQVKREILDYDKALKNEIQKHTDKLLKELDGKWDAVSKSFEQEEKNLKKSQSQIQKQIQEIATLLQQSNARDVFSGYDSLLKSMETKISPFKTLFQGVPKFITGDKTKVSLIVGNLEDVSIPYDTELKVNKKFETDLVNITSVVSCPDGSLWISDMTSGINQKVKPNGDNLSIISNFKENVVDGALLPSGDLLLSDGSSNLKLIPSGSSDIQDSQYTVSPLLPTCVHVTCDNKVIVGAMDRFNIDATGPRQVIVMDQTGHHDKVFQYDRHNKPLFILPRYVASNSKGNLAVVDTVSDDLRGRVVVLDHDGGVRNIYTGYLGVNNEDNPFRPEGITATPSDNFVVADPPNHLHILNNEGEIITFYNTKEMGILLPKSLSFSRSTTGQLYVGCGYYKSSKETAKFFIINKFLC